MKKRKIFVGVLLVGTTLLSSFAFYTYQILFTPNIQVDKEETYVYIPSDADFKFVQNSLYDLKMVNDLVAFSFLAKLLDYDEAIKPGRYKLTKNMSNLDAIRLLRSGAQTPTKIIFNNVRKLEDMAGALTENIEVSESTMKSLLLDSSIQAAYGFEKETFITMFIPNTYEVYWNIKPKEVLDKMKKEYDRFWNAERLARADSINMTPNEVGTLASIVLAESSKKDEQPMIAGVYMNRLRRGIALQADPTLIFAHDDYTIKRVLHEHKKIDSPYNTYKYPGLPPGPIRLPSISAIDAVLNFSTHEYYYFCAKEDFSGYHNFAKNLDEHLRNARKYQRALNQRKVFR